MSNVLFTDDSDVEKTSSSSSDPATEEDYGLALLLDETGKARWRECDLPDSDNFYDNVLAWQWGQSWPFIWDPEGLGLQLARMFFSGRSVRCVQSDGELDLLPIRRALAGGEVLVLHGIRRYDSRLKPILTKSTVERGKAK